MNGRTIFSLILLGGVFVMEGFDIAAMALAVPRLTNMGLDAAGFGWVFTALLVGLGAGGALLAPLGDRFGRRALIVSGCLVTGLATLATSTADTITEFLIWRFVTGLALGACLPNVSALSAELAPERLRATIMAVVSAGIPLGIAIAGITAPEIIDLGGWQGLFIAPGVLAVLLAIVLQFILSGERPASAEQDPAAKRARLPQLVLFSGRGCCPLRCSPRMLALNALNLYLLNSWLPTVLPQAGMSLDAAARVSGVVQLAGLAIGMRQPAAGSLAQGLDAGAVFAAMALSFAGVYVTAPDPLAGRCCYAWALAGRARAAWCCRGCAPICSRRTCFPARWAWACWWRDWVPLPGRRWAAGCWRTTFRRKRSSALPPCLRSPASWSRCWCLPR